MAGSTTPGDWTWTRWTKRLWLTVVILVTEHNAEVNAGFTVLRGSNHTPPLREEDWLAAHTTQRWRIPRACSSRMDEMTETWHLQNAKLGIPSGLALAPFCGHRMDTSLDWAVAWSLVGEWTTRTIFLPSKGEWPRQGHPKNLLPPYERRSVPMLTWARACFEQGSLPSLLALPGDASLLVLPVMACFKHSDLLEENVARWFYMAMEVPRRKCLTVLLLWRSLVGYQWQLPWLACHHPCHYGLDKIGDQSWAPRWTPKFCRHICRIPRDDLHIRHATNSWLSPDKVNVALGPDCDLSPHPGREVPLNVSTPYIDMLLGPQKPTRGQPKQTSEQEELNTLPSPEEVLVTLRLTVDSCGPSDVSALIQILLGGTPIRCRNHHLWIHAVRDYFDDVPLCVPNCQLLRFVCVTAPQHGCKVCLVTLDGCPIIADLDGLTQGSVPFPEGGVHVHIRPADTEVSGTAGEGPQLVNIDCTGLGGHDLGGFKDYDICLCTDKHSQSIYGPSVTPLESPGRDGVHQVTLVALGGSKAMQEFLVLHYLATDCAREWDVFLDSCLPECTWVRAGPRRALALHMYDKCHIAPSHRRFAHPSWIAGMKLMLELLLGARKHRYLGRCLAAPRPTEVYVRGFSAGSYSAVCLLHLLWNMPHVQVGGILGGISCPPALIHGISPEHGQRIMLIHLTTDRLCQWHPYDKTLHSLNCKYCIVDRKTQELKELFGSCEHSYGHWIDISLPHGRYPLYQLLRRFSDVAPPQARDIAPLRLVSWVSCEVPDHVQQVLNQLMVLFGAVAPVSSDEVIAIGAQQLGVTSSGEISWDMVRDDANQGNYLWRSQVPNWGSVPPFGWLSTAPSTPSSGALLGHDPAADGTGAIPLPV